MSNARPRSAIMANLPKQGWTIDKEAGTGSYKDLSIVFGPDSMVMTKGNGDDSAEVGTVSYGKSQMQDLKKLAASAGNPFAGAKVGGGGGALTPEQKKERQKKAAEKRQANKAAKSLPKQSPKTAESVKDEEDPDVDTEGA